MFPHLVFSSCLVALSATLIWFHLKSHRATEGEDLEESDRVFFRRQFRRRMLASSAIGVVGVAMFAGIWVRHPQVVLFYWSGVVLMVCGIGVLGVIDWWALRVYYGRLQKRQIHEHKALRDELKRLQKIEGNGKDEQL